MTDTPIGTVASIVIDVTEFEPAVSFWKTILGLEEKVRSGDFVWLERITEAGPSLAFQLVGEAKAVKNRLHLDVKVEDRIRFRDRVVELGGSRVADHTMGDFSWSVVADPAGNEFCIFEG